jgi:uncharacterized protein YggE
MSGRIKWLGIVALIAVALAGCATVQASSVVDPTVETASSEQVESAASPRTMTVVGEGKISLKPDIAKVSIGVEARAGTVSEAKAEVDARMATVFATLQEASISDKDVQTSHYSIHYDREPVPVVREGPAPQIQDGYRVSSTVLVTVRDVEGASSLLDAVVEAGANHVYGVNYTVSDRSAWQTTARAKAVADARSRAQELADLAGVELGEVLSVSEVIGSVPMMIERSMGGGGMAPGEMELATRIQVTFAIQ